LSITYKYNYKNDKIIKQLRTSLTVIFTRAGPRTNAQ